MSLPQAAAAPLESTAVPPRTGRRARWRLVACVMVVVAALGWIAVRGLTGSFVYYLSPTELVAQPHSAAGQRVRLGGYVVPGSVHGPSSGSLTFTVTDGRKALQVISTGAVPELFRAGQGVVLEGALESDGRFHSDTVLVKHDGTYRPPAAGSAPPAGAALRRGPP